MRISDWSSDVCSSDLLALSKVYTFGPTFRAENSNTTRHLAEFWMVEPDIAFADLAEDARVAEEFLKSLFRAVLPEREDDMEFLAQRVQKDAITRLAGFVKAQFERNSTEASRVRQECDSKCTFRWTTSPHKKKNK